MSQAILKQPATISTAVLFFYQKDRALKLGESTESKASSTAYPWAVDYFTTDIPTAIVDPREDWVELSSLYSQ